MTATLIRSLDTYRQAAASEREKGSCFGYPKDLVDKYGSAPSCPNLEECG